MAETRHFSYAKILAKVGDLKLTTKEENTHTIPPVVGEAALAIGVVLIGAGVVRTRRSV